MRCLCYGTTVRGFLDVCNLCHDRKTKKQMEGWARVPAKGKDVRTYSMSRDDSTVVYTRNGTVACTPGPQRSHTRHVVPGLAAVVARGRGNERGPLGEDLTKGHTVLYKVPVGGVYTVLRHCTKV